MLPGLQLMLLIQTLCVFYYEWILLPLYVTASVLMWMNAMLPLFSCVMVSLCQVSVSWSNALIWITWPGISTGNSLDWHLATVYISMLCVLLLSVHAAFISSTLVILFIYVLCGYTGSAVYVNKLVLLHRPVSMSLHGELSSLDEFRTVLNWQNGYSKFYTNTNKFCMAAPEHSLNSEPHIYALCYSKSSESRRQWLQPLVKLDYSLLSAVTWFLRVRPTRDRLSFIIRFEVGAW